MPRVAGVDAVRHAFESGYALPAINVANLETAQAILRAADACSSPVMLQVSPGAIAYAGYESIRDLAFAEADRAAVPVVVHLDHCRDPEVVHRALADGFGSVMFDGSLLPLAENVEITRGIVERAAGHGIAVEGELGVISGSEAMTLDEARALLTLPEEAVAFADATGVDIMAAAIGSLHRMPEDSVELDLDVVRRMADAVHRPLALHGGSGVRRSQLPELVAAGIGKVNISSRVSRALADGIRLAWETEAGRSDLRRYLGSGRDEVRRMAEEYMDLCGSAGRASGRREAPEDRLDEPE
ncbi:MAG TPA: class II fructose-bisphosphate aldolase [Candidatus Limnocylindria bacterium]|jgi:ketose-bisphosphate aldolase|nr:class II fructose-bisphosphate aldolase [Candidatus Limnocylindria bacterium]